MGIRDMQGYREDWIGLRTLDQRRALVQIRLPGEHVRTDVPGLDPPIHPLPCLAKHQPKCYSANGQLLFKKLNPMPTCHTL